MLVGLGLAAACGGGEDADSQAGAEAPAALDEFEAAVRTAGERVDGVLEQAFSSLGPAGLEAPPDDVAAALSSAAAALAQYAEELEGLRAPETLQADRDRHVAGLRALASTVEEAAAAATRRDSLRVDELLARAEGIRRNLVSELSTEYAAVAVVELEALGAGVFVGLSPEERAHLDDVQRAREEFDRRNAAVGAVLDRQYTSAEDLLRALAEAGAGTAFEAVRDVAATLAPPPRFEADHARWLALLDEQVRLDRLIGEAARQGDPARFELANHQLFLASSASHPELSPEFLATIAPDLADVAGAELDPEALAGSEYASELFGALKAFRLRLQPDGMYIFFPQTPDAVVLEVAQQVAPEVAAAVEEARRPIEALRPPDELAGDHARILRYFDELAANERRIATAAEQGDVVALRDAIRRATDLYCAVLPDLSPATAAVADVAFGDRGGRSSLC